MFSTTAFFYPSVPCIYNSVMTSSQSGCRILMAERKSPASNPEHGCGMD